jgi:hypothetical protein
MVTAAYASAPVFAEPSGTVRASKSVMIESHLGFNGVGFGFGYFLPNDSRIDCATSQSDLMQSLDRSEIYKIEYQSFTANSFFYNLGVSHRRIKADDYSYGSYSSYMFGRYGSSEIKAVHAHFAIGNEWSFRYFFIGAEWFGFSSPLTWQYTTYYPDTASAGDRELWNAETEREAKKTVLIGPNLYIGFAF